MSHCCSFYCDRILIAHRRPLRCGCDVTDACVTAAVVSEKEREREGDRKRGRTVKQCAPCAARSLSVPILSLSLTIVLRKKKVNVETTLSFVCLSVGRREKREREKRERLLGMSGGLTVAFFFLSLSLSSLDTHSLRSSLAIYTHTLNTHARLRSERGPPLRPRRERKREYCLSEKPPEIVSSGRVRSARSGACGSSGRQWLLHCHPAASVTSTPACHAVSPSAVL